MENYMSLTRTILSKMKIGISLSLLTVVALSGCSGGGEGSAVEANPQAISLAAPSAPVVDQTTVSLSATSSSGLSVVYTSLTDDVCEVNGDTGMVTGFASGACTIAANQSGNSYYAPAAQVTQNIIFFFSHAVNFIIAPALGLYDSGTITAVDSRGQQVTYASSTPSVCSVSETSGLVTALAAGDCSITAFAGTIQATQTISITAPSGVTVPGAPSGVTATLGDTDNSVMVNIGGLVSGGSPIDGFTVTSNPAGISATGSTLPITLTCPASCAGYAFSVQARNAIGTGISSSLADVITSFMVVETFYEPDTQPNDSIFVGTFTLNSTTGAVSNLKGKLSESMTGGSAGYPNDTMTWLSLNNQLVSWYDATLGGTFVATFKNTNTNTFSTMLGGDGWSPQAGVAVGGIYYGFPQPANNSGNAYTLIFVPDNPLTPLTQAQIDKLAYADCAPGGMMGAVCMTGTTAAGYGAIGTMSGYPVSQVTTKAK
jgi:hypothetical protein